MYSINILTAEKIGRDGITDTQRKFESFYRRSNRRAYNLAFRLLCHATEAEDITNDVFVRAWRHFDQYDRARPFEGWLFRIVTNLVVDCRRRQKRVPMYSLDTPIDTVPKALLSPWTYRISPPTRRRF